MKKGDKSRLMELDVEVPACKGPLGKTILRPLYLTYLFCKIDRIDINP